MNWRAAHVTVALSVLLVHLLSTECLSSSSSSSSSVNCTSGTEAELLAVFQPAQPIPAETDSEGGAEAGYNLTLTWQPSWGVDVWQRLGCLAHARSLTINGSALNYSLPDSFASSGAFPQLTRLLIENSSLGGTLPDRWAQPGAFPELRELKLSANSLTGVLPAAWGSNGSFPKLQVVRMASNSLTGTLPNGWASSLPQLQDLQLSNNSFAGSLPVAWGSFPDMLYLGLGCNALNGSVPAEWGSNGSFAQLQSLNLKDNRLTGSLVAEWGMGGAFSALEQLWLSYNRLSGSIPAAWGTGGGFPRLVRLDVGFNNFKGSLPSDWGTPGRFPKLQVVRMASNNLSGSLPASWSSAWAFPQLLALYLQFNKLSGSLPISWGANGGFARLEALVLSENLNLTGVFPPTWGRDGNFPGLALLDCSFTNVSGELPRFSNPNLSMLSFQNTSVSFSSSSSAFWANTSSPFLVVDLSKTFLEGSLPAYIAFNETLKALNVDNTRMHGKIPAEWLQPNALLSRAIFGGQSFWRESLRDWNWRRAICSNKKIYQGNVGGKTKEIQDEVISKLSDSVLASPEVGLSVSGALFWVADADTTTVELFCRDLAAMNVIVSGWVTFLVAAAAFIGAYIGVGLKGSGSGTACLYDVRLCSCFQGIRECCAILSSWCSCKLKQHGWVKEAGRKLCGLFGLGVYTASLVNDVRVIRQVWGAYYGAAYGYVLLAIFLGHHVYRGIIVFFYLMRVYMQARRRFQPFVTGAFARQPHVGLRSDGPMWMALRAGMALFLSPLAAVLTYFMDVWSFFDTLGVPSPPFMTVESYADMRSVLMPALQSIFTAVIITASYWKGHNPKNGELYPRWLFIQNLAVSCAGMLMGLWKLLYLSHSNDRQLLQAFFSLMTGHSLRPSNLSGSFSDFVAALLAWLSGWVGLVCNTFYQICGGHGEAMGVFLAELRAGVSDACLAVRNCSAEAFQWLCRGSAEACRGLRDYGECFLAGFVFHFAEESEKGAPKDKDGRL